MSTLYEHPESKKIAYSHGHIVITDDEIVKSKTPDTVATVSGAKPSKSEVILNHIEYALIAILLWIHPAIYGLMVALAVRGVFHV